MSEALGKIEMEPCHPGAFVRAEVVEPLGLSISRAADILGVRRATLSDLLNGNTTLSPELALRLEMAFGIDLGMLLRMQAWYDAVAVRAKADRIKVKRYDPV